MLLNECFVNVIVLMFYVSLSWLLGCLFMLIFHMNLYFSVLCFSIFFSCILCIVYLCILLQLFGRYAPLPYPLFLGKFV